MRVALYARVSTKDKDQNPETQLRPLRAHCNQKVWGIIREYVDYESGRKSSRPEFNRLKKDAVHRRFDTVLVWKMDRFSRSGIKEVFATMDFLNKCNVIVVSLTEPYLSTDSPVKELLLAILAWVAEFESRNISARVKAGMERARAEGKRIGRKPLAVDIDKVIKLRNEGMSFRKIADELNLSVGTVHRAFHKGVKNLKVASTS